MRHTRLRADLPYLFSFIGSLETAPVRRALASLTHPRAISADTAADYQRLLHREMPGDERLVYARRYADAIRSSKFILCPRGFGVSSMRLFDAMRMGRVPVILADEWVEPPGPQWEKFSLRVAERDAARVPQLLEEHEGEAVRMGLLARQVWEDWFSEEAAFHRVTGWCLTIKKRRRIPERWGRWPAYWQCFRPFHFRHIPRTKYHAWRERRSRQLS